MRPLERAAHRRGQAPERAHRLVDHLLRLDRFEPEAIGRAPFEQPVDLEGDDVAQGRRLVRKLDSGEPDRPGQAGQSGEADDQQPPAPADRQHPAEQPRAAVEHRAEHDSAEDEQQRLGEEDHREDGEAEAEPDAGALELLADQRIAKLGGAERLVVGQGRDVAHRRGAGGSTRSACSELPARPERKAVNQLIGLK